MEMCKQQKVSRIFTLWGVTVASLFLCGCNGTGVTNESFERPDYYTRGIGQYPGNPKEDFSPELAPDKSGYRNIALLRSAFSSSSHDYNLTAQLATDGIATDQQPPYLILSTPEGEAPRREREWMIDEGPYSRNTLEGVDTWFQFTLKNYSKSVDKLVLVGNLIYNDQLAKEGFEIICQGSNDGQDWSEVGRLSGKGLPGEDLRYRVPVTDPNKQTEQISLPVRKLNETISFDKEATYSDYRVLLKTPGAHSWVFMAADFYNKGRLVEMKPSQFFHSSWMSATSGEEWLYVDLGSRSELDKVILHWINKAVKGSVQISDNAAQWTDVAELPGGENLIDEISLNGKKNARYVRVRMQQSANGERYILSELEVMGKGGLVPQPAASPAISKGKINLSGGNWKLQRASEVTAAGEKISTPDFKPESWIVATVPGTVLSSYKNIGAVADPNYADNQLQISESFFNSDFWYRNEFEVPADFKQERLFLNFDGINWKANVYVNGKKTGRIEGAFMRGKFDVTEAIVPGKNVIAVEIIKNEHIGAIKEKNVQSTDFNGGILGADNPTFHATVGWDWIPTMRGRNMGIWNDVFLTTTGSVTVADPLVTSVLPLPDTTSAVLTAKVIVKNHDNKNVQGVLEFSVCDQQIQKPVELAAGEEKEIVLDPLKVQNPRLWWPKGYGEPNLYDAHFAFKVNEQVSDRKDFKVGIRQMTFNEDNQILSLFINGRRFIGRGGNWGFSESNLNYRAREYDIAVAYHADMNFTIMRNWVGMIGDEELYDACDRHGIVIWQDFWLANPADGPDPYYPEMFIANAEDYVKRIRSHASIGIYCGRNEGFPPEQIDQALRRIIKKDHSDIHYIPSSADEVVSGHGPYRMLPAKEYFTLKTGNDKFHSERGMPNVLTYESMLRTFSPEGIWPQDHQWGMHDYTREGAQGATSFNEIIAKGYGEPQSAKEFSELAQWVNYDGHRSLFESRSQNRKGLLMWMSHSCWPSMVWQTYDYFFEPTAAYFAIKKASEPLHIQWNPATDEIEVVNYNAGSHKGLVAKVQVLNMDASVAWEKEVTIDSNEDTTNKCIQLEFPENLSKVHFIKMSLTENGEVVSQNFYHRSLEENNYQDLRKLPKVALQAKSSTSKDADGNWNGTIVIENTTSTPALMIRVNVIGEKDKQQFLPMFYSDNYFALLPGEKKEVRFHWKDEDTRGNAPKVVVSGYNVE
ncbi:beta-galactosidase/beta-glucuronidase [Parabacteroides sp. PF5-5]|uniref:glycosyl hydrolase 2 galactose-binding domain-containing protein n=1 Tax=unclassified Parabacteroides TaxID=2649774 RepID=UPI00247522BF|nr:MULTISPECIES: discoidin domain-containing protein [unclassified Parabacteroides]MDH6304844.1 beta-galactosidase/beta-glucuronidase [Parabacteroides sp. PH5-39]MDH6316070.1 beta-galactosidase/beta-glucuronidase [Parabacteroides sp. PF5-13]MDH6319727.1 beta-galactosidase/beta-glucuronidase [Parabacteroides sp. PH5-13]MDH6323458.1 beta-galactosidase/beta-glucuronidase [Parabacteroides sp. PH5-8]MDH6327034.1 beta-galactosidase/beta-glucuronidase [Parabacteroides sp. PH5-41]